MSASSWPLQVAVLAALQPALAPVPVLDDVPQGQAFPYVVIGEDTVTDWPMLGDDEAEEIDLTLHVWSRYAGRKEAKHLMAAIKTALHQQPLPVDGQQLATLRFSFETLFVEPDGLTRHGVLRFRALCLSA
ncbi:hypothetical protein J2848_005697 [Azospirillum lipoferum]|uniref:DUF3168 domain-containing protein n=1 Tax=Azospirillum lipoferum TaxID=193 RepID=A0A5A9GF51_AZOLI|nr:MULTISPECIES: DUF3168 domain-containing protein [Azospirillum]KAA0592947.1 DUF3168 domain-containing protein [Azospirillum lipoferum]MCP1613996.1 hypothetical protein [Azospirillum lipoferum]MDW5537612.1 DUF3168 domain-containing protein [Azospirillum sp. NL1]